MLDILLICVNADAEAFGSVLAEQILARHAGYGIVVASPDADGVAAINDWLRRPRTHAEVALVVFGRGEAHPKVLAGIDVVAWRDPPMLVLLAPGGRGADTSMVSGSVPRLSFATAEDQVALARLDDGLLEIERGGTWRPPSERSAAAAPPPSPRAAAPGPEERVSRRPAGRAPGRLGSALGALAGVIGGLVGARRPAPAPAPSATTSAPGSLPSATPSPEDYADLNLDELLAGAGKTDTMIVCDALGSPGGGPATRMAEPAAVVLGASAPRAVAPGDEFTARFVAYVQALEASAKATLIDLSPGATPHLGIKQCQWAPGTTVAVSLRARGLTVEPASQAFTWDGTRALLDFDVTVPDDVEPGPIVLKFDAAIDGITVATLRVDLRISAGPADGRGSPPDMATAESRAARTAFASYSSADRQRVLDRVAAVRISAGLDVFLDCLSLHPGQEWLPRLEAEITGRDVFLLFWSRAAAESTYVSWEWQTALCARGKGAMQIHPLEAGLTPPAELADLHSRTFLPPPG